MKTGMALQVGLDNLRTMSSSPPPVQGSTGWICVQHAPRESAFAVRIRAYPAVLATLHLPLKSFALIARKGSEESSDALKLLPFLHILAKYKQGIFIGGRLHTVWVCRV